MQKLGRRSIEDTVDGPRERAEDFIVEGNDDGDFRQVGEVFLHCALGRSWVGQGAISCYFIAHQTIVLVLLENLLRELLLLGVWKDGGSILTCACSRLFILDELIVVPVSFDVLVLKAIVRREGLDVDVRLLNLERVVVETQEDVKNEK